MLDQMEREERESIQDFDRYHDEFWRRMTQSSNTVFYVAEASDGQVVGMVWLSVQQRISGAKFGWVYDLTVDAKFRRKGIGRMLLRRAYDHFKACGISSIGLMVLLDNHSARELYENEGFRERSAYVFKKLD